jgi:hypothetical protein
MNRYTVYLAALALTVSLHATTRSATPAGNPVSERRLVMAEQNYVAALGSENAGLVESAIAMVARLSVNAPERDFTGIREKLNELALHGGTASIRFKAYLVSTILDNRATTITADDIAALDNDGLFALIATRLQASLLGFSGH